MGSVGKTIANIATAPISIPLAVAKGAATGGLGGAVGGLFQGSTGQQGLFGSPQSNTWDPFSSKNMGQPGSQNPQVADPGAPPAMMDPRSAEYAFENYQQKYSGRLPPSAQAGMAIAQNQGARLADRGVASAAGSTAAAQSSLARKGGLSQGAQERLARGGAYDALMARQQGAAQGAGMAQNAAMQGLQQSEQTAGNMTDAYMRLLQQNQQMAGNVYAANKGASILANQSQAPGLFGGSGFLGTGLKLFG
jgi:hypothetical protein